MHSKPHISYRSTFKVVQLNAENLFLYLDAPEKKDWEQMSEVQWQSLSSASVSNKSLSKTLRLAQMLKTVDADLICLNEVGGLESIENFARLFLDDAYIPHLIEGNSDRGIDVGFLLKADLPVRAELRTHKDRPLGFLYPHEVPPETGEPIATKTRSHYFSRDCAELRIFPFDHNQPSLVALAVHLKSKLDPDGIDLNGTLRRQAEFNSLLEIYAEIQRELENKVPILIAGDFNGQLAQATLDHEFEKITGTDLKSVTDLAGLSGQDVATQIMFNRGGGEQHLQIDYILCSEKLAKYLIKDRVEVWRYRNELGLNPGLPKTIEQRQTLPSDHYPVICEFFQFVWPEPS